MGDAELFLFQILVLLRWFRSRACFYFKLCRKWLLLWKHKFSAIAQNGQATHRPCRRSRPHVSCRSRPPEVQWYLLKFPSALFYLTCPSLHIKTLKKPENGLEAHPLLLPHWIFESAASQHVCRCRLHRSEISWWHVWASCASGQWSADVSEC